MGEKNNSRPKELRDREYRYDAFGNGRVLLQKKKDRLPAMGWNSWNAFGSGNTEALTKAMADALVELGLDQLGYRYVVLDDGCYKSQRVDGRLSNETEKFPGGFKELSDYIHGKGLKFGMYNDIGTNLCAGAAVGTCGHEDVDARSYLDWGVDFLKVDNCYYLWDNATFSDAANAKYVYAPDIRGIRITGEGFCTELSAVKDGILQGRGVEKKEDCVTNIGTFDGTGPAASPVGQQSGELWFTVKVPETGSYRLTVSCIPGQEVGRGSWLQVAVGTGEDSILFYDDFVTGTGETAGTAEAAEKPESADHAESANHTVCVKSAEIEITLQAGENVLRLMNHRRQENTLGSYAALLEGLNAANPDHDVVLSICEWGKTQPQNWGYKVGDSWRILNDITFRVGADGDPGVGAWTDDYTPSVISQYNKAVIMDEFAGLEKGWNDPDMLMVGMNGLTETMYRTHMAMWCMMNSPLMLGLDLRRVKKGDALWQIIANRELIALNQDALGVQAKRIYSSVQTQAPDREYIREYDRVDILAKPLADGSIALAFFNISQSERNAGCGVDVEEILKYIGSKMKNPDKFAKAASYRVRDLWSGETKVNTTGRFEVKNLEACGNVTVKITPEV
ncbi:MAG: glycoside hydrolase family 27 protein [Acetatifactor sp.]